LGEHIIASIEHGVIAIVVEHRSVIGSVIIIRKHVVVAERSIVSRAIHASTSEHRSIAIVAPKRIIVALCCSLIEEIILWSAVVVEHCYITIKIHVFVLLLLIKP